MKVDNTSGNKNLIVYKASAGSGKTFTLVSEYLAITINENLKYKNSRTNKNLAFDKILAITFTNKATAEMKIRILNTLYNISHKQSKAQSYIDKIIKLTGNKYSDEDIINGAIDILSKILHNYDSFDVKTIDSFFQNIVSNIALMTGYNSSLEVYLEDNEAISKAVDNIVSGNAFENDKKKEHYLYLLNKYIDNHIEEGVSWDFRKELKDFGKNICRENYMMNSGKINIFFDNNVYANEVIKEIKTLKTKLVNNRSSSICSFIKKMESNGISFRDIKNGNFLKCYFEKIEKDEDISKSKTGQNYSTSINYWIKKSDIKSTIGEVITRELFPAFKAFENERESIQNKINSIDFTLKNINEMRMLSMIDEEVKKESRESNRILLSKSQELIKEEIKTTNDISFVYEQAGKQYKHIMLDEAQDTSRMQWDNLGNFLSNVISNRDGRSVVVGDIKQSIYRWRNGDWTILANIGKNNSLFNSQVCVNTLDYNYRSETNIVNFNSCFFKITSKYFDQKSKKYSKSVDTKFETLYDDVTQKPHNENGQGYVQIDTIAHEKKFQIDELDEIRLKILTNNIGMLHRTGLPYSQMAILVRSNKELTKISNYIENNNLPFKISTNEAKNITNAQSINMIISAIRVIHAYTNKTDDILNAVYLAREYQRCVLGNRFDFQKFNQDLIPKNPLEKSNEAKINFLKNILKEKLPQKFITNIDYLCKLPLCELCMELTDILSINELKNESAYIYTFFDFIDWYSQNNSYDICKFLDDWELEAEKQKISETDTEGISAMTIHSAKGLEFHTVFMPYCDWDFIPRSNTNLLWCTPQKEPYSKIPLVPVNYKSKIAKSIYSKDYEKENFNILVDNLNTLYVAFTRPKANLFIELTDRANECDSIDKEKISNTILQTISDSKFCKHIKFEEQKLESSENYYDNGVNIIRKGYGTVVCSFETKEKEDSEHFSLKGESTQITYQ